MYVQSNRCSRAGSRCLVFKAVCEISSGELTIKDVWRRNQFPSLCLWLLLSTCSHTVRVQRWKWGVAPGFEMSPRLVFSPLLLSFLSLLFSPLPLLNPCLLYSSVLLSSSPLPLLLSSPLSSPLLSSPLLSSPLLSSPLHLPLPLLSSPLLSSPLLSSLSPLSLSLFNFLFFFLSYLLCSSSSSSPPPPLVGVSGINGWLMECWTLHSSDHRKLSIHLPFAPPPPDFMNESRHRSKKTSLCTVSEFECIQHIG